MGDRGDGVRDRLMVTAPIQGHGACDSAAEAERADDHADQHEPEHRAEPQAMEQRDHHGGGAQDDQRGLERRQIDGGFHPGRFNLPCSRRGWCLPRCLA